VVTYRGDYTTDTGKVYFSVSLFVSEIAPELIPEIFSSNTTQGPGFCALPRNVKPRKASLIDTEGLSYQIEYPFKPGTPEWILFWEQIKENPLVISSSGNGEIVKGIK
jgi:hypothetical protein